MKLVHPHLLLLLLDRSGFSQSVVLHAVPVQRADVFAVDHVRGAAVPRLHKMDQKVP